MDLSPLLEDIAQTYSANIELAVIVKKVGSIVLIDIDGASYAESKLRCNVICYIKFNTKLLNVQI